MELILQCSLRSVICSMSYVSAVCCFVLWSHTHTCCQMCSFAFQVNLLGKWHTEITWPIVHPEHGQCRNSTTTTNPRDTHSTLSPTTSTCLPNRCMPGEQTEILNTDIDTTVYLCNYLPNEQMQSVQVWTVHTFVFFEHVMAECELSIQNDSCVYFLYIHCTKNDVCCNILPPTDRVY